jgi:hypothetical protein
MPTYQYTPLHADTGEIRLIELHAGKLDDKITISIITTPFTVPQTNPFEIDLDLVSKSLPPGWSVRRNLEGHLLYWSEEERKSTWENPGTQDDRLSAGVNGDPKIEVPLVRFEALSYTWGSIDNPKKLQVACEGARLLELEVTQNLDDALRHLRNDNGVRVLWIDAISINQNDLLERNQQVKRMRDIYTHAQRVVVWLGPASLYSAVAMHTLGCMGDEVEVTRDRQFLPAPGRWKHWDSVTQAMPDDQHDATWHAVHDLLQRPWFDRLWIIQEVRLANSFTVVQCGEDVITWRQLRRAILLCSTMRPPRGPPPSFETLVWSRRSLALHSADRDPIHLFLNANHASCGDPRDKIYSLLGLLPRTLSRHIQPRYDRPVMEVYREAFQAYISCADKLDLLNLAGPSWIPDWTVRRQCLGKKGYYSTANSAAAVSYHGVTAMMAIGMTHDLVERVGGPLPDDNLEALRLAREIWLIDATPGGTYPTGITMAEACAWTFESGRLQNREPSVSRLLTVAEATRAFIEDAPRSSSRSVFARGSFIFKTKKGYYGLSPRHLEPKDVICLLLGHSLPAVLRPQPDGRYLFVGSVYIHGLMDGEALLGPLPTAHEVFVEYTRDSDDVQTFRDVLTGRCTTEDPRLGPLPTEWETIVTKDRLWHAKQVNAWRNRSTQEIMYSDPRLLPDALAARGVVLETLTII